MTYEEILRSLALENENIVVMTAENRAAIRNLPPDIGNRFVDVGICEQTMIGAAAGLALRGRIPIVHALATFLTLRAYEFARTDVGIGNLPVKLVGGVPGFLSEANGPTHQAIEDVGIMRSIPPMRIFCPADAEDMEICLKTVLLDPAPYYIRYNTSAPVFEHSNHFAPGKAETVLEGKDVVIFSYGFIAGEAWKAAKILRGSGVDCGFVNLRTLKPIDEECIQNAAKTAKLLVTVEDHFLTGGLYSILAELLLKHKTTADVLPIALDGKWFVPALLKDVLEREGFTASQIAASVTERFANRN